MFRIILGVVILILGLSTLVGISIFNFIFAILLIAVGIVIIGGKNKKVDWDWDKKSASSQNFISEVAILSPLNLKIDSKKFQGGKIVMVLAGGEIDLSNVKSETKEVNLEVVAVFAGCKLILPKNCAVNHQGTAFLGGYDNKVKNGQGRDAVTFNIKGAAIFGGIEMLSPET